MDRTPLHAILLGTGWFPEQSGGLDKGFTHHFQGLQDVGVDVRGLVTGSPAVEKLSGGRAHAFADTETPLLQRWRGVRSAMQRLLRDQHPDLVASHFALYTFPVLDLIRPYPLVVHFHGPWALESRVEGGGRLSVALKGRLEATVYRRATRYIVLTQAFADVLQEIFGVSESKVSIVPGGVDTARFDTGLSRKEARARLGWPEDRPLALVVRRLVRRVGLENLVTAIREVRERVPDVLLLIAGKGPLAGELEAQIEALGLGQNVRLLGFVSDDDLPIAYRAADVSIVPSTALEGFGLITVESFAAGTPALVTPVGGLPEAVRGLSPDLVLPGAEVADLADGLSAALSGEVTLPDGEACQSYARRNHDWSVIAERVREVYDEVVR